MSRQAIKPEGWWQLAAALMVKHSLSLREAAHELGIELSVSEADALSKRVLFREILEQAEADHYREIGPRITKEQIEGLLFTLADRLADEGESHKASDALLKLAKVKGIVGYEPDTGLKTLHSLNNDELTELKRRLREQQQGRQPQPKVEPEQPDSKLETVN